MLIYSLEDCVFFCAENHGIDPAVEKLIIFSQKCHVSVMNVCVTHGVAFHFKAVVCPDGVIYKEQAAKVLFCGDTFTGADRAEYLDRMRCRHG